ncbi:SH3 domain-containing protein [Sphingomicrobium sp. XHP0239]|uniref:SH3 domain-containing protein n=1 Tax=Sphingomicrobium maritimum TaxID=3133972 RepID=UPI0031CCD960
MKAPTRGFHLTGPSDEPDPAMHAFRKDLADVALAGTVIASHYAHPVARELRRDARLWTAPDRESPSIVHLSAGAPFALLDSRGGWVWGYGGEDRLVGYLPEEALV